jgi:hypothetical protein
LASVWDCPDAEEAVALERVAIGKQAVRVSQVILQTHLNIQKMT